MSNARESTKAENVDTAMDVVLAVGPECRVVHNGYPSGFTCLDKQQHAKDHRNCYGGSYGRAVAAGEHLCIGCRAKRVIERVPTPAAPSESTAGTGAREGEATPGVYFAFGVNLTIDGRTQHSAWKNNTGGICLGLFVARLDSRLRKVPPK